MNRIDQKNGMNEREALDTEEGKIADMLGALPRVEAPADFEFGIKARIASGEIRPQASLFPFLKIAVPLSLVLLVAGFVIFYGIVPGGESRDPIATVAPMPSSVENKISEPAPALDPTTPTRGVETTQAVPLRPVEEEVVAPPVARGLVRQKRKATSTPSSRGGGSYDTTQRIVTPIRPRGFEPAAPSRNANVANDAGRPVRELFELLGVKAEFVGGGWTVRSTALNSVAARAGVLSNDVIEAINDQNLAEGSKLKSGFEGRTLRVRRDGKQIKLDLRKKLDR